MLDNERDKSYIYDILKYSQEISDILKGENHNSFVNNRIKRLVIERLIQIILFFYATFALTLSYALCR